MTIVMDNIFPRYLTSNVPKNALFALLVSYVYATSLLLIAEVLLRRTMRVSQDVSRKFVHILAGSFVWGVLLLFDSYWYGLLPFATFIFVNGLLYKFNLLESIDAPDKSPGTIYFAAIVTGLFAMLWDPSNATNNRVHLAVCGIMAMTWGDAFAALFGARYGRRRYRLIQGVSSVRSVEGSLIMFVVSAIAIAATLFLMSHPEAPASLYISSLADLSAWQIFTSAILSALVATVAEAASPWGTDNIFVPIVTAATLAFCLP